MKPAYILVIGGILIAGSTYIYLNRDNLNLLTSGSGSPERYKPPEISWGLVDRSREGFTLQLPSDPREIEVPAYNESGAAEQVHMIYAYPDPSISFSISWADQPPVLRASGENPNQTLDEARNGALARTQSMLVSEAQSTRQGFPVHDFVGRNQNGGIFDARLILAGQRLYLLMASFPSASARHDDDVNRFFDSFRVVSSAPIQ